MLIVSNNRRSVSRGSNESEMTFGKSKYETAGSALVVEGRGNEPPLGTFARLWQRGETEH
jgi:hypothetical protein